MQHRLAFKSLNRDDVPDVLGDNVRGEEIDVLLGVVVVVASTFDDVSPPRNVGRGAFHLHPPKGAANRVDRVVGIRLSPGLGDAKVEARCPSDEFRLRRFSAPLVVPAGDNLNGDLRECFAALNSGRRFCAWFFTPQFPSHNKKSAANGLRPETPL